MWLGFRDRFPWLLTNVTGGLLCAVLVSQYEHLLDAAVVLAVFLPMVLDHEPKPVSQDVSIKIPSPDSSAFTSKIVPVVPAAKPAPDAPKPEAPATAEPAASPRC